MLSLREFAGNAAHELRTPLSIMLLGIGKLPDGDAKAKLLKDVQGMKRLVGQMLDMAQASAITIEQGAEANLSIIAREIIADLTPLAIARGRIIAFEDRGCPPINGHADAIGRALRIVIENALAHTPEGTSVDVTFGPGPVYEVRDHGPGIPAHLRTTVLDRFTRLDHRHSDGAGLGLAIASAIMQVHGGVIEIGDTPRSGASVRLLFSAARHHASTVDK